jgi:NAD(P)-dependent dehydrogenase (short-subunit alcohol dehydrogenase family)
MIHDVTTSFRNMSDKEWDQVHEVHLKGAFSCTLAAWPIFRKQKFGRIVNTASAAGLFGERPLLFQTETVVSYSYFS